MSLIKVFWRSGFCLSLVVEHWLLFKFVCLLDSCIIRNLVEQFEISTESVQGKTKPIV